MFFSVVGLGEVERHLRSSHHGKILEC